MELPEEIPVFDEATETLLHAARVATAARASGRGYLEAVEGLVSAAMALPGCSFAPTDEELIKSFLQKKVRKEAMTPVAGMREANVSLHNPMTLSAALPQLGEREWYFFTPRDRKYRHGVRPNRATEGGFWKATGADKAVMSSEGETIGFKKSLVFNLGGHDREAHVKTNWIMYEYRLNQPPHVQESDHDMRLDDWVLCSIHDQPQTHARRVAAKRRRNAADHHVDDLDVNPEPLQQYVYVQQQQLPTLEQEQYALQQPSSSSSSSIYQQYQSEQYYRSYQQDQMEQLPSLSVVRYQHDQYLQEQQPNASAETVAEHYYRSYQQDGLEQPPSLFVEQEHYANPELQLNASTSVEAVAEQYRYQHGQYQYLEQQPLPASLGVVGQEQYAYHLPTILDSLVINEQYAQQPTTLDSLVIDEQYARVEAREQYRYLEQQPMPLINKDQLLTPDTSINPQAGVGYEPMPVINKDQLQTPDTSINPQPGVGYEFDWVKDFFDLSELIEDNYMSSNQGQGTTSLLSTAYNQGEAASAHHHSQHQHQQQHHQEY